MIPPASSAGSGRILRRIAVALPLVLVLGYVLFWFAAQKAAVGQVEAWIQQQKAQGIAAATGEVTATGFPFDIVLKLAAPEAAMPAFGWSWQGPPLELAGKPWSLTRFDLRAPGTHAFTLAGPGGTQRHGQLAAGSLTGAVFLERGRLGRLEVRIGEGDLTGDLGDMTLNAADIRARASGADGLPVSLDARGITFRKARGALFGDRVERLALDLLIQGPWAPGVWPQPVLAWRDAGGVVQIRDLAVSYGPLLLAGEGTAALDRFGQPEGAFTARVTGFAEAIQALRKMGYMEPGAANAAQVVLGLIARGQGHAQDRLDVPLTLQDRTLSVGPVQLLRLRNVDWFRP